MPEDYLTRPAASPWHHRMPIGDRVSAKPLVDHPMVGFEGDMLMAPLEPMLVPERPRSGELDPGECFHCARGADSWIWKDDLWHVGAPDSFAIPFWAGLAPNQHVRLHEMSPDLLTSLGGIVQRLAGAIQGLEEVARTHFSRWGDGSAHFHMAFMARPLGMMQARGYMLPIWDDLLPPADPQLVAANRMRVARVMAEGGGAALV